MISDEKCSIYCHISPKGKKYIGISLNPVKRWRNGKGYAHNQDLANDIQKYGWDNFAHLIIADNLSVAEAKRLEAKLIKTLDLQNEQKGYNIRDGGNGAMAVRSREKMSMARAGRNFCKGKKLSDLTKEKISKSLSAFYQTHIGTMAGKHHDEITKAKLSKRTFSDETRKLMSKNHADFTGAKNPSAKAVTQYSKTGEKVNEYAYAKLAADNLNLDLSSIIKCCRGRIKTVGGYIWKYANTEE